MASDLDDEFETFEKSIQMASSSKEFNGLCCQCKQAIMAPELGLKAMGKIYHQTHFLCSDCQKSVEPGSTFYVHPPTNKPYHPECYEQKFYEECQACHKKITDKILTAKGEGKEANYHTDCFKCGINFIRSSETDSDPKDSSKHSSKLESCGKGLRNEDKYLIRDDKLYCESCFTKNFVPTCAECNQKITKDKAFAIKNEKIEYYSNEGKPYCNGCFEKKFIPTCARCEKKILKQDLKDGSFLSAGNSKYHPDCYTCYHCGKMFPDRKAYLKGNELLCREHYDLRSASKSVAAK